MNKILFFALFLVLIFVNSIQIFAQSEVTGSIKGKVIEKVSGDELPFANILVIGKSIGAATDVEGNFIIRNVPTGEQEFEVSFLGFKKLTQKLNIVSDRMLEVVFELSHTSIVSEEVLVTAQAKGQLEAINEQLNANSIVNVVSADKIRELPDANAAESVGRLPGVSVQRDGGEGNKVVIRGLSPKFNAISIDGVRMAATGYSDRSSNLSMISPYMLEGIEVSKAVTAEQDADVLGGSVNFRLKKAPVGLQLDGLVQGIYNGLSDSYNDYKIMAGVSDRFFDDSFGVFAQVDIEDRNRGSHELGASYELIDKSLASEEIQLDQFNLRDISRDKQRFGGALVLDYDYSNGNLKLSSFGSMIKNDIITLTENHNIDARLLTTSANDQNQDLSILVNSIEFNHYVGGLKINALISNSFSENDRPHNLTFNFREARAYEDEASQNSHPSINQSLAIYDLTQTGVYTVSLSNRYSKENETTGSINFAHDFNFSNAVSAELKFGGKYRHKTKMHDYNMEYTPFQGRNNDPARTEPWLEYYGWEEYLTSAIGVVTIIPFLDPDYKADNFLSGEYLDIHAIDVDLMNEAYLLLGDVEYTNFVTTAKDDYSGTEDYSAGYASVEFNLWNKLTVTPGLRYERNSTSYNAVRGDATQDENFSGYVHHDTTATRLNEFWLPSLLAKYKPYEWLTVKFAYTNTLSRPNYNRFLPNWNITANSIDHGNPLLEPARSTNFDLSVSIYENYIGLLGIGAFNKNIEKLIFNTGDKIILDPTEYGLPDYTRGSKENTFINNIFETDLWGIELEWQTHFWYLPGVLSGLVFNVNYTHIFSEAKYPFFIIESVFNPNGPPFSIDTQIDTFFTSKLIDQPEDIVNFSLGYDYKGFSARFSYLFQASIFSTNNRWTALRGLTEDYSRWDFSATQKLPIDGLTLFVNFNNITPTFDRSVVNGRSIDGNTFPRSEQHYGRTLDFGFRYNL